MAIVIVALLSGFTGVEVEFTSIGVPPSEFKIRLAEKRGLPPQESRSLRVIHPASYPGQTRAARRLPQSLVSG